MNAAVKIACLLIALALLGYTVLRACNVPFTHDESYTYLYCSHDSFMEIISNRTTQVSANNHILNTLFMKLWQNSTGSSEIALRMHSILAHAVYLLFTFLLLKDLRSGFVIIAGFLLLNINPYLLEFFSLARGYALAISFMLVSMYYFIRYLEEEKNRQLLYCMITASLAVLSNFALLNYLAAVLVIHQLVIWLRYRDLRTNFQKSRIALITVLLLSVICYEPIRKLIRFNCIDFGGMEGIWENTVASQINVFLYEQPYDFTVFRIIDAIVLVSVIAYAALLLTKLLRGKMQRQDRNGFFIFGVLLLILFFNALQHYLLGSPYIVERFALFITPLYMLVLVHLLNALTGEKLALKVTAFVLLITFTSGMGLHFSKCANLSYASNWNFDADTKKMLLDLEKEKAVSGRQKIKLGVTWIFEPGINFYRESKKLDWLETVTREDVSNEFDLYYIEKDDQAKVPAEKKAIHEYPASESLLMK
ncbi:MAG: hypothetical protein JWO09_3739 [Bacteroidetes bacterium]|nr:hypothetical protein [Bacteroidota bacterium]